MTRAAHLLALCLAPATLHAQTIASRSESTPFAGVRVVTGRTASPTTDFVAAYVSLCTNYVHVAATRAPSALSRTSAWASGAGVQLAVNGDFFVTGPRVYGYAVGGGAPWPLRQMGVDPAVSGEWYYRRYGWIGFGPGLVEFSHTEFVKQRAAAMGVRDGWRPTTVTTAIPPGITALVSGFPELVTEGRRVTCSSPTASSCFPDRSDMRARHPRTAMGLTQDRRTFILLTVDGRSTRSAGMYGTELARLMELLGAYQAFNLDGGGSSTFWQRGVGVRNRPSDGAERSVANHWGVFAGSSNGRPRAPGSCYTPPAPDAGVRDAAADVPRDVLTDVPRDALTDVPRDVLTDVPRDALTDVPRDVLTSLDVVAIDAGDDVPEPADDAPREDIPEFVEDASRAEAPDAGETPDLEETPGCGCRAGATRTGGSWILGALVLWGASRRRRGQLARSASRSLRGTTTRSGVTAGARASSARSRVTR
ncbi:MAG: phosphodiester glycosidase family protein [Polyangiales bacterium]